MSLTKFLENKNVQEKFSKEFATPTFNVTGELKATPLTNNFGLVGTAFDYLLRFYLKSLYPKAVTKAWIAEKSVNLVNSEVEEGLKNSDKSNPEYVNVAPKAMEIVSHAKSVYSKYLKTREINDEVIKCCLLLAQLDLIYRAGKVDLNIGNIDYKDVQDMRNLLKLTKPEFFTAKKQCILNPTIGEGSKLIGRLVGKADADIIIDDLLIDIKTTKFLKLDRKHFNQLIGYYFLSLIGGIDGAPKGTKINKVGIYFSRHGILYTLLIDDIIKKSQVPSFIRWLKKRAK